MYTFNVHTKSKIRPLFSGPWSLSKVMMKPHPQTSTLGPAATFVACVIFEPAQKGTNMVKDGHKLRHSKIKSCKNPAKARNRKVIRGISHTYVFFQGRSIVFQAYQGNNVKAPRTRQDPASLPIARRQPLKGLGLQGSGLLHPVQGKAVKGGGYKVGTTNLEELAFPPREEVLEGG